MSLVSYKVDVLSEPQENLKIQGGTQTVIQGF